MATFYLILVIILFFLAISDLVVGVSNDAVNFLNSAIGAKAATFRTIMFVAALGVVVGATFSSGMMEVARKGIFHPEYFYFSEIIIIFLAVMVTDVILLDAFNTYGFPTSTTVSIVFELLGAAVAISAVKVFTDPEALGLYQYINTGKALAIISGILISVAIAFTVGALAQYLSRLVFSFDYKARMRRFGAIWGGLGVMAITYFMLIKGAKGASFMSDEIVTLVNEKTGLLLVISFAFWTLVLFLLNRLLNIDILKVLVLIGTFALAMAFAGNDLVNFIGVPLAGYNSYQIFMESSTAPEGLLMSGLSGQVATPTYLLLLAGLIMVLTLYTSKKARSVVKTSLDLGRQDAGYERFSSSMLSRSLVRNTSRVATFLQDSMPESWKSAMRRQFDETAFRKEQESQGKDAPVFDMIRASTTLVVASILIAIGTNLKLPLSTTYVTFMVFMGASLADGAWGRESAVYRVTGVLSVIGGWFFTALSAFTVSFIIALIFRFGGMAGIIAMLVVAAIVIYRTHSVHKNRVAAQKAQEQEIERGALTRIEIVALCARQLKEHLPVFIKLLRDSFSSLRTEDLSVLREANREVKPLLSRLNGLKLNAASALDRVPEEDLESAHLYLLILDYLHEMGREVENSLRSDLNHVDNSHKPLLQEQVDELMDLLSKVEIQFNTTMQAYDELDATQVSLLAEQLSNYIRQTRDTRKRHIKRIQNRSVGTRNSLLYINHLGELRNLTLFNNRIVKVLDDLILTRMVEQEAEKETEKSK